MLAAPALVASVVAGDSVASAELARWLFSTALTVILVGEVLLVIAMKPAPTLRVGAVLTWLGLLLGIVVRLSFPEFRFFRHWSWLGYYISCLILTVWVFGLLIQFADETRPRKADERGPETVR